MKLLKLLFGSWGARGRMRDMIMENQKEMFRKLVNGDEITNEDWERAKQMVELARQVW